MSAMSVGRENENATGGATGCERLGARVIKRRSSAVNIPSLSESLAPTSLRLSLPSPYFPASPSSTSTPPSLDPTPLLPSSSRPPTPPASPQSSVAFETRPSWLISTRTRLLKHRWKPHVPFPGRLALAGVWTDPEALAFTPAPVAEPLWKKAKTTQTAKPKHAYQKLQMPKKATRQQAISSPTRKRKRGIPSKPAPGAKVMAMRRVAAEPNGSSPSINHTRYVKDNCGKNAFCTGAKDNVKKCNTGKEGNLRVMPCGVNRKTPNPSTPSVEKTVEKDISMPCTINDDVFSQLQGLDIKSQARILWIVNKLQTWTGIEGVIQFLEASADSEDVPSILSLYVKHEALVSALVIAAPVDSNTWLNFEANLSRRLSKVCATLDKDVIDDGLEVEEVADERQVEVDMDMEVDMDIDDGSEIEDAIHPSTDNSVEHECSGDVASPVSDHFLKQIACDDQDSEASTLASLSTASCHAECDEGQANLVLQKDTADSLMAASCHDEVVLDGPVPEDNPKTQPATTLADCDEVEDDGIPAAEDPPASEQVATTPLPQTRPAKASVAICRPTAPGVYDLLGIPTECHGTACRLIAHLRKWDKKGNKRNYIRELPPIPGLPGVFTTYTQYRHFIDAHVAGGVRTRRTTMPRRADTAADA